MTRFFTSFAALSLVLIATGCVEEGHVPDCPEEDFRNEDGTVDEAKFDAWRKRAEDAGCLTPIGGTGQAGASGN